MDSDLVTYDASYAKRHSRRNAKKVKFILKHVPRVASVLDIGTNQGYLIRAILEAGKAKEAFGLELETAVVDPVLKSRDDFTLYVTDIVDFKFERSYSIIIFNAVIHHVIGKYGLEESWRVWEDIIDHCDNALFFETGLMAETGEYYWKDALQIHYTSDRDYLNSLIRAMGPRLKKITHVVKLPIHDIKRIDYKFEFHPIGSRYDLNKDPAGFYGDSYHKMLAGWTVKETQRRSTGSNNQSLITSGSDGYKKAFGGTTFYRLQDETGKQYFAKKPRDPYKEMREYMLLNAVSNEHVINLTLMSEEYGLVFKFIDWEVLGNTDISNIENRSEFIEEIKSFFAWTSNTQISTGILDIEPGVENAQRSLIDLIDMHANNFMLQIENNQITDWVLIDLEYFSNENKHRNLTHLAILTGEAAPKPSLIQRLKLLFGNT